MVKVEGVPERRLYPRVPYRRPVVARTRNREIRAEVLDISDAGLSLLSAVVLDNDTFVKLHVEGVGEIEGRVVRTFDGGFAVVFDPAPESAPRQGIAAVIAAYRAADKIKQGG